MTVGYTWNRMDEAHVDDVRLSEISLRKCHICGAGGASFSVPHRLFVCFDCRKSPYGMYCLLSNATYRDAEKFRDEWHANALDREWTSCGADSCFYIAPNGDRFALIINGHSGLDESSVWLETGI